MKNIEIGKTYLDFTDWTYITTSKKYGDYYLCETEREDDRGKKIVCKYALYTNEELAGFMFCF